jgi:hypothetical protein
MSDPRTALVGRGYDVIAGVDMASFQLVLVRR